MLLEAWGSIHEIHKRGGEGHLETSWILVLILFLLSEVENSVLYSIGSPRKKTLR